MKNDRFYRHIRSELALSHQTLSKIELGSVHSIFTSVLFQIIILVFKNHLECQLLSFPSTPHRFLNFFRASIPQVLTVSMDVSSWVAIFFNEKPSII